MDSWRRGPQGVRTQRPARAEITPSPRTTNAWRSPARRADTEARSGQKGLRMSSEVDDQMRRRLYRIAYRLVGSSHDAEDAVSEGVLRWEQLTDDQRALIREPLAWLTRVVSRVCLDHLKSARVRREHCHGIWLPEAELGQWSGATSRSTADPADVVAMDESISYAFMVALEKLTPAERVSFILHDVFQVPFSEIAETVGRSAAACRQSASSARKSLTSERRFDVSTEDRERVVSAFVDACRGGQLARLVKVLDPDVTSLADGGAHIRVAQRPVVGAETVAQYLLGVLRTQNSRLPEPAAISIEDVNGRAGIVLRSAGRIIGTIDLSIAEGKITRIHLQVDPAKLSNPREPGHDDN